MFSKRVLCPLLLNRYGFPFRHYFMGKSGLSTMKKTVHCKCKSGCSNRRCVCLQNNESCDELCGCSNCKNPLSGMDVEALSVCTIQNIEEYKYLSIDELEERYELPCGCEKVPLKYLLGDCSCSKCGEVYWYSFCWNEVVQLAL